MSVDHGKIRGDLDDCQRALTDWWSVPPKHSERELHTAIEALLRAVSTLAHGLEAEQTAAAGLGEAAALIDAIAKAEGTA